MQEPLNQVLQTNKQLWEIYNVGDFIDAKDNQGDWRMGIIVDKNITNGMFKVRFDGWQSKYDQFYKFNSPKLSHFRSVVIGYTGKKKSPATRPDWKFSLQSHKEKVSAFQKHLNTNNKTAWEINQFFRGQNYIYCDFLMTESYESVEEISQVMKYFLMNVQMVAEYLKNIDPQFRKYYRSIQLAEESHLYDAESALVNCFYEIMDTLFTISGNYSRLDSFFNKNSALFKKLFNLQFDKSVKKAYQLRIIEKQENSDILQVIKQLISQKLSSSTCFIPLNFLNSLASLYIGLSNQTSFKQKKHNFDKLIKITKQNMLKLNQKSLKNINKADFSELIETLKSAYQNSDEEQTINVWALQQEIKFYVKMVECPYFDKKLKGVIGFQELVDKNKMQPNATVFINTLLQQKVFDILFSSDNAEIIKKSVEFCRLLNFNDIFPFDIAFRIWQYKQGKHQVALQQIYSLIASLPARYCPEGFEGKLFQQISKQPKQVWDQDYIKMLKDYSLTALSWAQDDQSSNFGFDILLQNAVMEQTQFSINSFIELLHRFEKSQVIQNFMAFCFEKIQNNDDSYIYTVFLSKLIDEKINDFREAPLSASSVIVNDLLINSHDSLERNSKRFQFLSELTKITCTNVTFQQFMSLWEKFRNSKSEKAMYNWVFAKKEEGKGLGTINPRIGTDIRKKIFESVWGNNYDFFKMTEEQSVIFVEFFKSINFLANKIKRMNSILKTQTLHLIGFNIIWKAFENLQDDKIALNLASLIVEVYMCPSKSQQQNKQEWIQSLINEFSKKISKAYGQKQIEKVNRLLMIPAKIISRDEEIFTTSSNHHFMREYKVINTSTKQQKLIKFFLEGKLYDFKKAVADKFKVPFQRCRLSCKGQFIKYENYFRNMDDFSFVNQPFELQVSQDDIPSIKKYLNSQLELLFKLLGDVSLQKNVWAIIEKLPIAEDFLVKIENSKQPWEDINSTNIYKQLYIMRAMGYMSKKWWNLFLSGPGLINLSKKFTQVSTKTKVQREYLKSLCENIERCLDNEASLQRIDLNAFVLQIFKSLDDLLESVFHEQALKKNSVQATIISFLFEILKHLESHINVLSILIKNFDQKVELLQKGFLTIKSEILRNEFTAKMKEMKKDISNEETQIYLNIILKTIFEVATSAQYKDQASQYFSYSSFLVDEIQKQIFWKFVQKSENEIINQVKRRLVLQKEELNSQTVNHQLVGFLNLARKFLPFSSQQQKQMLSQFILNKCFFPHLKGQTNSLLCKTKESKTAAFSLFSALIKNSQSYDKSLQILSDFHKNAQWRTRRIEDWSVTPGEKVKSTSGYVGLKNLGCICYMNSFLQQIFMIPDFKQAILQCDDPLQNSQDRLENVLYQVKKMFFSLMTSEKKYYIPNQFCSSFKNYEGLPTNVFEQMDIDEFSGILFDRLENQMKGTRYENIIKDFFGGVFSNQIICKGCPHFSETEQSFLSIGLNVKSKKNIYQSFDTMIKGDTLDGDNAYFCERCNKKVSAVKRVCLKKLPDHLILTLKRFEFDFQTMNKMKLNDYCQFPTELNIKEYSQQHLRKQENPDRFDDDEMLPDSYYDYTLQGVVIHIGHADSGHYYSFIRQRKDDGKWLEFNDTVVKTFDVKKLAEEAFGGQMGTMDMKQKIKNAYMLIYERKKKMNNFDSLIDHNQNLTDIPIYNQLFSHIQSANTLQKIQNILFSTQYTNFAQNLIHDVQKLEHGSAHQILKFVVLVYLTVTIRQKEESQTFDFLKKLTNKIEHFPLIKEWVLQIFCSQKSLIEFFKNNMMKNVKKLLAYWVVDLSSCVNIQKKHLLVDNLLAYIMDNNQNSNEICLILYWLIKEKKVCQYFISKRGVGVILENVYGKQKGVFKDNQELKIVQSSQSEIGKQVILQKPQSETKKLKISPDTTYVWAILSRIVQLAQNQKVHVTSLLTQKEVDLLYLPASSRVYKILQECKNKMNINKFTHLIAHLVINNQKYTDQIMKLTYKGIKELQSKAYRQFFILIKTIFNIKDDLTEYRTKKGLGQMMKGLKENENYPFDFNIIKQWIVKILRKNSLLQQTLRQSPDHLNYLLNTATKKTALEEQIRKNNSFQETTKNKYHGIKLPRSKKGYEKLNQNLLNFFKDLSENKVEPAQDWQSDQDISQMDIMPGGTVSYFDINEKIEFVEAKIQQVFLNSVCLEVNKNKMGRIWKDDEKITSNLHKCQEMDSEDEMVDSQNTTEMELDEQYDPDI